VREQLALLVPDALFHRQPAHALDVGAFDLAAVNRRVDAAAHVVHDVHGLEPPLARERVDLHLGDGRAVAEVVERPALQGLEVVGDVGRHVEARHAQAHAVQPGLLDQGLPGDSLATAQRLPTLEHDVRRRATQHAGHHG
jgi:hypothetical protein